MKEKVKMDSSEKLAHPEFKKIYILINPISVILFIILALYLTILHNKTYLFKLQDLSLFLPTKMFFFDIVETPGGFLSYIGLFFTQFFYYPWLGSLIFIFFLLVIQFLTIKAFKLHLKYFPLSFIPSLSLLLALSQLGYYIYVLYSKGYIFSSLFGIIFVLGAFWIYRNIDKTHHRLLFSLLFILFFFHLLGFYSLYTVLLFILYEIITNKKNNRKNLLTIILILLISMFGLPFLYCQIFIVAMFPNVYFAALPEYYITGDVFLYLPFVVLFVFLTCGVFNFLKITKLKKLHWISWYFPAFIFLLALLGVFHFSYDDENFRTELAMEQAIFENNWQEVLALSKKHKGEPTRLIVMDTYLALQKLHIAGDKMFTYKNGNKPFNSRKPLLLIEIAGKMFYYQYGKINFCYRWCMEDMMHNGMKIENLKYFVKSCLLNKELPLAKKYNDILMKTMFHKSWAQKYQKIIDNLEKIFLDPEFKEILPLLTYKNNLCSEDLTMFESFILYSFATINQGTPEILELSLQCILEYKNRKAFWPCFSYYVNTHSRIPVHYQEAALLFYALEKNVDISKIKFDKNVLNNFQEFVKMKNQYTKMSNEASKTFFNKKFGNTYWYYYFFFNRIEKF